MSDAPHYKPSRPEVIAYLAALGLPPSLVQLWYGSGFLLMFAATAAIVVPLFWLYVRMREGQLGLPLTSFSSFLGRLFASRATFP